MEYVGVFPEGDWESLGKMFCQDDLEFTPHFLGQCSFNPNPLEGIMFPNCENSTSGESLFQTLESLNSDLQFLSQESSYSSGNSGNNNQEGYYFSNDHSSHTMPIFLMDQCNNINNIPVFDDSNVNMNDTQSMEAFGSTTANSNPLKRSSNVHESGVQEDQSNNAIKSSPPPPKKPRVQRSRKNAKTSEPKEAQKRKLEEEVSNATSSYSSEDDNASQENNGDETPDGKAVTAVNLNGKARASRGAATDPQSLYARKRRERINERLRILQNLVPNGTKVDISTMLEEAVQYVKFLQLQIKLLSSDDMWMYAPLAYNGMDIGLNNKLSELV